MSMKAFFLTMTLVLSAGSSFAFDSLNCTDGFHNVQLDTSTQTAVVTGYTSFGIPADHGFTCKPFSTVSNPLIQTNVDYYTCNNGPLNFNASVVTSYGVVSMQLFNPFGFLFFNGGCLGK